jgi:hypothetical protein
MAQVVTNENMLEFIQNGEVPQFKAPDVKAEAPAEAKVEAPKVETPKEPEKATPPRGEDGKFVKADEKEAAKAADDDPEDADLPERVRRQIGKKHRMQKEAEEFARDEARRAMAAEARAEQLQRELEALKNPKSGPDSSNGDEPKPDDFKTVGEYAKALTKWEVAQAKKAEDAEKARQTQARAIESATDKLGERVAEFAKATPDYAEVMETADWDVPPHMQAYFVDSENPGLLGYHLAKNPDEFDRIAKLSPIRAFAELGKLEDKLTAKPVAPAKEPAPAASTQVSRAPAPIQPLEGKSTPVAKDPSQMTFQELRAYRQEQRAAGKYR